MREVKESVEYLIKSGWSPEEIASTIGVSQQSVQNWRRGTVPHRQWRRRLAHIVEGVKNGALKRPPTQPMPWGGL